MFGTTIRRITNELPNQSSSDIYAQNGWWNADATLFVQNTGTTTGLGRAAINTETGAFVKANLPAGTAQVLHSFDPVDRDSWYYFQNAELRQFNISTDADTLVYTFSAPVEKLGGSVDWIDRTGRYFLVAYSGKLHIFDRSPPAPALYAGDIDFPAGAGWAGISPDGRYVVTAIRNQNVPSTVDFTSYLVDHTNRSLPASGTMFWNLCGDHGDLVTASDGETYLVTFECFDLGAVYRVRVDLQQSINDRDKQRTDNVMLLDTDWPESSGHFSCVSSGPNRDWCFISIESDDDTFDTDQTTWRPYKQEIIAVQVVLPFAVRRLAHHRSRSTVCPQPECAYDGYFHQPRLSSSWDGRRVAFLSNFGYDVRPMEYSDIYVLDPNCAP